MSFKQYIIESLPDLKVGDVIRVGKWKNKPVEITGFGTDDNNQPTIITKSLSGRGGTKERKMYAFKVDKLINDNI